MKQPLVSIIIPFYNEEEFLERAINSAINQSYDSIEVVLVNDGSIDNSKKIAEEFCKLYSHIQLVNSLNESLGAARNKGIALVKGEYITFLDADDELDKEMVKVCLNQILNCNSDVAISKFTLIDDRGEKLKVSGWKQLPKVITAIDAINAIYSNKIIPTAWGKLYKTEIIKHLKFPENIWFEDNPFLLEVFFNSKRITFVDNNLMKVYSRKTSITRRVISIKRVVDINKAFYIQLDVVDKYVLNAYKKQEIEKKIIVNQFSSLLDTFIVISIDKYKVDNIKIIRHCYLENLSQIIKTLREKKLKVTLKGRILCYILNSPKHIGWNLPELVISFLKNKKYRYIKNLKG